MFDWLRSKSAASPGSILRHVQNVDWDIELDLTKQRLRLQCPEETTVRSDGDELAPTCSDLRSHYQRSPMVSLSTLALKAKLFDDSLYAAAEVASQPRKAALLVRLANSSSLIAAAARLGGNDVSTSPGAEDVTKRFLADGLKSKPLGFYTWNEELSRIFRQDRLLQEELESADVEALTAAMDADSHLKAAYRDQLTVAAGLTNPFHIRKPPLFTPEGRFFLPPSRSLEGDLAERLYGDREIPDGFSLADEVVERVGNDSLTLQPTSESGWYDYQSWALEPLIAPHRMPEAARLTMEEGYRKHLRQVFKSIVAMTRETHVKQLDISRIGAAGGRQVEWRPTVVIKPEITVEPVRSYYQRRADGYAFVRQLLDSSGLLPSMKAITSSGPSRRLLDEDLEEIAALFRGASAVAGHELGMEAASEPDRNRFREWAESPDVGGDVRMMVPIFYDQLRRKTKVWAILGWAQRLLSVSFAARPDLRVVRGWPKIEWSSAFEQIAYPVFAELYVTRLLDRDEFRALCDRYKTAQRILDHL